MSWVGTAANIVGSQGQSGGSFDLTSRLNSAKKGNSRSKGSAVYDTFLGGGLGLWSDGGIFGQDVDEEGMSLEDLLVYKQLPDYPETTEAISEWSKRLKEWGGQEGYGAIPMNWDEIWNTAKDKLNRYYWGGVNDTGLAGKVRASAARRGVSQSPALENQLSTLGFQQGIDMRDLATTEATNKVNYGEAGRNTWLGSLERLSNLKPNFISSVGGVESAVSAMYGDAQKGDTGQGNILGSLGSLLANYLGNNSSGTTDSGGLGNWAQGFLNYNGGTSQNSLVSSPSSGSGLTDYFNQNYSGYKF